MATDSFKNVTIAFLLFGLFSVLVVTAIYEIGFNTHDRDFCNSLLYKANHPTIDEAKRLVKKDLGAFLGVLLNKNNKRFEVSSRAVA